MPEIKLKPCPFCGSAAKIRIEAVRGLSRDYIRYSVYCPECKIRKYCDLSSGSSSDAGDAVLDKVVEGWNMRAEELIHCKDCKYLEEHHYEYTGEEPYIKYSCKYRNYQVQLDGYCSSAIRRIENETD